MFFFFFKQKTAYEMRISDWSSDVCSSDLPSVAAISCGVVAQAAAPQHLSLRHMPFHGGERAQNVCGNVPTMQAQGVAMTITTLSSRQFNHDASGAKKADRKSTRLNSSH